MKTIRVSRRHYEAAYCPYPYRPIRAGSVVPFIRLSGHWLDRLGFSIGAELYVESYPDEGVVVLRLADDDAGAAP